MVYNLAVEIVKTTAGSLEGNKMELWKPVIGFENLYEISNLGRVRSLDRITESGQFRKGKIRECYCYVNDYKVVKLYYNGKTFNKYIHRLLAEAFVPNPNPELYDTVNHIDGNRGNNSLDNLEWCTQKQNIQHAWKTGLIPSVINSGESNTNSKLTEKDVLEIRAIYVPHSKGEFGTKALSERFGVTAKTIGRIIRKELWKNI